MLKRSRERQLDLLAPTHQEPRQALPEAVRSEVREALQILLIELIVAERGGENGNEQDQR